MHHGLTSSDVLDTALALQLSEAGLILAGGARDYRDALIRRAREHADTLCVGRTHGIHAEPTTFGVKLAGFAFEAQRNLRRLERAVEGVSVGALSGAVGTYSANGPEMEAAVLSRLGLGREDVSTQVVPRDRHAELLDAIALAGAGLERFATEVRHLQRTEVREVEEPFRAGPEGLVRDAPQAQPDRCERITGIARLLRGYAQAGLENVALWHERDISHSSVERVACRTPRSCSTTPSTSRSAWWRAWSCTRTACAPTWRPPTARSSPSALCSRWWRRPPARRGVPDRAGERPAGLGHGHPFPRAAGRGGARAGPRLGLRPAGLRAPRADDRRAARHAIA